MKNPIYLDYAAATPMDNNVLSAMMPFFSANFYNPSANYDPAIDVKNKLNDSRGKISFWLGAKPTEIIFTAGGTEANNLAISGVMQANPDKNLIVSAIEHDSVLLPAKQYLHKIAPVDSRGMINLPSLLKLIDKDTVLISVMHANNEVGTIQPIKEIAQKIKAIRSQRLLANNHTPLYLHTDASQSVNYLDIHHSQLGVDLISLNGGKIYGPKQTGILFVSSRVKLSPLMLGGGQENNLRSGTENVAGFIGLACALDKTQLIRKEETDRLSKLQSHFFKNIAAKLPDVIINGSLNKRLPNNIHLSFPGVDNEMLIALLNNALIYVAAGSACSASNNMPSHVLKAMGITDDQARSSLRISMGRETTLEDIDQTISIIVDLVKEQMNNA